MRRHPRRRIRRRAPTIGAVGTSIIDAPPHGLTEFAANLPTGLLPAGGPFTEAGDKTWHVVPGTVPQFGQGTAKVFRYTVEIENGVDTATFGGDDAFVRMVDETLANPKSWTHNPQFAFVRIDSGKPDFRISLSSPVTIREGCGYEIPWKPPATTLCSGATRSLECLSTRLAGCAERFRLRAMSVPTGSM
ncbi:hypothetical protein I552_9278 [Mycobacterium xenopi 3993]|nr:hypothetical protein I552_9278 [Mycobacterium xenopi 3993]